MHRNVKVKGPLTALCCKMSSFQSVLYHKTLVNPCIDFLQISKASFINLSKHSSAGTALSSLSKALVLGFFYFCNLIDMKWGPLLKE